MKETFLPFNRPTFTGGELDYIKEAVRNGHISGDGPFTKRAETYLEQLLGVGRVLLTTSCTHALEMSAILLDFGPDDEVIVPSFTFVSVPNAFVLRGARPIFVDIREDTLNVDVRHLAELASERTRAMVVVHYAGVGCEMDSILEIARTNGAAVIEDNAHGLFGKYRDRHLGTFGSLATLSFHETKNITCGEGGALLINASEYIERAEIIREKGTNRAKFFRGQVDKYTWVDVGSSYIPSDVLAAILLAQLESHEAIQERRREIWTRYHTSLTEWASLHGVRQPVVPSDCASAYHLYHLVLPDASMQQRFIGHLRSRGVMSVFHYQPLHLSRVGTQFGGKPGDCPVSESISERLVRLPFHNQLSDDDVDRIIEAVTSFVP
jgi:dTDP-4-amino-4,6-dideoxygalactose transaminase